MSTWLFTHPSSLGHDMGPGHPERPERIKAVEKALAAETFAGLNRVEAPRGTVQQVMLAHPKSYCDLIAAAAPAQGMVQLDADTRMNPGTFEAILHGVGAACAAVGAVMSGSARNAFVATRPPGHHAETATAMGFCFFNNIAIAARHAKAAFGAERVAIVDFDVHHGNGTQEIFWADKSVLFCSSHEMPLYPGSGAVAESGEFGQIVNVPLRAGDGGAVFREAYEMAVLPRLREYAPDLLLISAGFDAHHRDPLANIRLVEGDFAWITGKLLDIAEKSAGGRVVSLLEGGYDLQGLAGSAAAHVGVLMGR